MRNCLIVVVVLIGCALIAGWLALHPAAVYATDPRVPHMIASWQCYEDNDTVYGIDVTPGTDEMYIDVPALGTAARMVVKGHWNLHAFYIDSHLDSPPEVMVAHELKNEDLEVDIGRYVPAHPGKIVCVERMRLSDDRPPYPTDNPGTKVSYPPPKGLIRVGMLQCDLQTLPWHPDRAEYVPAAESPHGPVVILSPDREMRSSRETPLICTYHSDRPDASNLLVTVYQGRVTEVNGGAEGTADIPYQLPAPTPSAEDTPDTAKRSWAARVFDSIFAK